MNLRLLSISSMYQGYLNSFYLRFTYTDKLSYKDHYNLLMYDTTEFAGSYTRNFVKLGINAECIISNDMRLQLKWGYEHKIASKNNAVILMQQVMEFNPDILWFEDLSFVDVEWLNKAREFTRLIVAYHCAPFNDNLLRKLKKADLIFTCTPGIKLAFDNLGFKAFLVYHGFDNDSLSRIKHVDGTNGKIIFSGSLISGEDFHNYRLKLIEDLIKSGLNISLYLTLESSIKISLKKLIHFLYKIMRKLHLQWITDRFSVFRYGHSKITGYSKELLKLNNTPLYGIEMISLFKRSDIVLNIHGGVAGEYAGNMRMFEATGSGSCLVTDNKRNIKDLFDTEYEVVVYDSPEDCIKKVRWLLEHDEERKRIALAGQKKTLEFHTVENRCRIILDILIKELSVRN